MQKLIATEIRRAIALYIAVVCSITLTIITIVPPVVAGDWTRLDQFGKYIPNSINYNWPSYTLQFFLWLGLMLALWWAFASSMQRYIPNIPNRSNLRYMSLLVVVILLGFGLRLYTLERLPLLVDEIGFAARASDMFHGQHIPIFAPGHNGNPATFSWLMSGSMALFGQNRFAMRLVSLAFGTLSIPAAYVLGREWWSRQAGLIAAVFLATFPAHVYFSRLALYNIVDPFFALLTLAVLGRALRRMRLADFVLAGVLAGIAQYFYHGSRLLPVLMLIYILFYTFNTKALRLKGTENIQLNLGVSLPLSLCVMLFAFVLTSLPRYAPMFTSGLPLTGNLNAMRLPADLGANALRSVLAWVGQPDISPFWLSSEPFLPLFALLACGVGLVICLRYLRDPRHVVIVMTLVLTTIFGGVIWTASPLYVRYISALPALVLLVALPFEWIQKRRQELKRQDAKNAKIAILALVLVIVAHGMIMCLQQPAEAYGRVAAGLWEQDSLARAAAQLPEGLPAQFKVSDDFGLVDRITIADYVAAYGRRRLVTVIAK